MNADVAAVIAADKAKRLNGWSGSEFAAQRWPVYIAAIEAVTGLHTIEKRYHDGSSEWSCDTPEEAAEMGDCELSAVDFFEICSHCGELEMCDAADDQCYSESMWPCPTIRALAVLAVPSTEEMK